MRDRYFSSASSAPARVFPRLLRHSKYHLARLTLGNKIVSKQILRQVIGQLDPFPHHLALEDQGRFVIGYFHQLQNLYASRKDKEEGARA